MNGWIKLYRQLLDHPLWTRTRFTPGQAWVDLLLSAAHADHAVPLGTQVITEKRGELLTSQVKLAARWGWDRETVRRFFRAMETINMCRIRTSRETETGFTLITIVNFERYQGDGDPGVARVPASGAPSDAPSDPASVPHPCPTHKKGKKGKNTICANELPPGFTEWWAEYPKKVGKAEAVKAWAGIDPDAVLQSVMLEAIRTQKRTVRAMRENDTQYIMDPSRWLRNRHWEDETPRVLEEAQVVYPQL